MSLNDRVDCPTSRSWPGGRLGRFAVFLTSLLCFLSCAWRAGPADAAPVFTATGGTAVLTELETFLWVTPRFDGDVLLWEQGVIGLSEPGKVSIAYVGKEAVYADNIFRWDGVDIFSTGPSSPQITGQTAATPFPPPPLATYEVPGVVPAGPLPLSFFISETSTDLPNDGNPDIAYWPLPTDISSNPYDLGSVVYVLFNDTSPVDTDHNDMIIQLSVVAPPVPEPWSLGLAAAGILPLAGWMLSRRRGGSAIDVHDLRRREAVEPG